MKEMWNERFNREEFVYGKAPNTYFKESLQHQKPGKILLPGEGEGRNAVFAAKNGWEVFAFDQSEVAKEKAFLLAKENQVEINYAISDIQSFNSTHQFDAIALIFVHLPTALRKSFHQKLIQWLKPGGVFIMEAFHTKQIQNKSGGPKKLEMLYNKQMLEDDLRKLRSLEISEIQTELCEGNHHVGHAEVIRVLGIK